MKFEKNKRNKSEFHSKRGKRKRLPLFAILWRISRRIAILSAALLLVTGIVYTSLTRIQQYFFSPMDVTDQSIVSLTVESGSSLSSVAKKLEHEGLVRSGTVFKYYADFTGLGQRIQSGRYTFSKQQSAQEILSTLITGDGLPKTMRITVIPGWTVEDIAEYFLECGLITDTSGFLSLCNNRDLFQNIYSIAQVIKVNNSESRKYVLEGYLSPNTYEVYTVSSDESLIRKLLKQTESSYLPAYEERADSFGMTMDDVLTLASIIEKEAKKDDFAKVSAVFHNRLSKNMSLDSDATIKYITGSKKIALNSEDIALSSPFNTYRNKGLPPGPICNPSADAIVAAVYPDENFISQGFLYFCSTDPNTGTLHFSRTLKEHEAAVAMYRPLWEEYDLKKGWK